LLQKTATKLGAAHTARVLRLLVFTRA
jgi:hypothetical protein